MNIFKFCLIISLNFAISSAFHLDGRIAHGYNADPHTAPYIVSLQAEISPGKYHHSCGGVIIAKNWIITAAHCLSDENRVLKTIIKAGRHNLTAQEFMEQERKVFWYKNHELYPKEAGVAPYDIGLIFVKQAFDWTEYVQPISLPNSKQLYDDKATLYGWGLLSEKFNDFPEVLQTGHIPIITNQECIELLNLPTNLVHSTNICTVSENGISACSSDSGGPLVQKQSGKADELLGIVSWGPACGQLNKKSVSVYVNASNFIEWIHSVIKNYNSNNII